MAIRTYVSFAELLRRLRLREGYTQEGLAERAGLSRRGISDIERGLKRRPYRDTIARLADALELSPAERAVFEQAARSQYVALRHLVVFSLPAPAGERRSLRRGEEMPWGGQVADRETVRW